MTGFRKDTPRKAEAGGSPGGQPGRRAAKPQARNLRVAVDVGGTFTDIVLTDRGGRRLVAVKVNTTPSNRADGVMNGIHAVAKAAGVPPEAIEEVVHGSTTGTNALIERTGAKVGFLTTRGLSRRARDRPRHAPA